MARNYQAKEAYKIIQNRFKDPDTYVDFVRKFPGLAGAILSGDMETLCNGIPFGSARQFDKAIWDYLNGGETAEPSDSDDEEEEVEEQEEKKQSKDKGKGKKKEPEPEAEDDEEDGKYAGMSPKKLYALCQERKLKVKEKQEAAYYIEKLEYADKRDGGKKVEAEEEAWGDDEEEEKPKEKAKGKAKGKKKDEDDDEDENWDF